VFKWMLVFTLLLPTICFADTDDYVHADFYRGLVGLKKQVDEINREAMFGLTVVESKRACFR